MSFDKHITPTAEQLLHCGVRDASQALRNLDLLGRKLGPIGFSDIQAKLFADLSRSADPDMALNNFERFVSALSDIPFFGALCRVRHDMLRALITIFGASRFLSTFLVTMADESLQLLSDPLVISHPTSRQQLADRLAASVADHTDDNEFFHQLRLFRKKEMLRIGLRDLLARADLQETVADLSHLAEVCLQRAYEWADAGLSKRYGKPMINNPDGTKMPAGFAVIAMGKLGGEELNFSSDVDLMYVYTADGETEGTVSADGPRTNRITNHQYFIKFAERLSAAIGEKTEDGFVFRVDLRLRPEGQSGPLAQSLDGYEIYYESWGQTWERSALIKARPVAGDETVGRDFLERIEPFVFRKYLDYRAVAEIRDMKQKINRDVERKGRMKRDVKLGHGGIREVEFVIHALQLIYAGKDRTLRERNALKALQVLSQKGLISYREHEVLSKAYIFLRTVEHRIQILDDLQTQTLPVDEGELRALARRAGYFETDHETEALLRDYTAHTGNVRGVYDDLFAFKGEEGALESSVTDHSALLDPETPEQDAISLLGKLGFKDPGKAYRDLLLLREGTAFVHQTPRSRKLFNEIFPALFQEIISSPDPDMALNHLESFLAAQGSWEAFQTLMKLDLAAGKVLIAVFANSEYLSRMLVSRPILLQNLIESRKSFAAGTSSSFAKDLADMLELATDITEKLDALRRFKHLEEIRIGMADLLSNESRQRRDSRDLSKLAEVCLDAALSLAASETAQKLSYRKQGTTAGLAVIGVGKLGGRELTYGSDLDILFVFSEPLSAAPPQGLTVFEYFSKVAEKTISYLSTLTREGYVFRVDTRLRPTGSKGPLAQSIDAFTSYYSSEAETWELQALLQTRFVAGDRAVGETFCRAIRNILYQDRDRKSLANDIIQMRKRMENEVGRENATSYNIKQGAGGLVDIEFLVQFLQLLHGKHHGRVRIPGTFNALRALNRQGLIDGESYHTLVRAYLFMRQLESRMRIVSNQATSELIRDPDQLLPLARRMGYTNDGSSAGRKLLLDYESLSRQVRLIFDDGVK